jgi:hypothetical protein
MTNTILLLSFVLFLGLLLLGGYTFLYTREVLRLEKTIGVTIPAYIHNLLRTVTFLSLIFAIIGLLFGVTSYFFP